MGWKQLEFKDRWSLVTGGLQAAGTVGMFVVALVGIWKVAPIITYQVQQQESKIAQGSPGLKLGSVTDPFVIDALGWWTDQVQSYQRIVYLTSASGRAGRTVSFEIVAGGGTAIAPDMKPDLLVVTATGPAGKREVVTVPVNKNAMSPSQYLRFKINEGVFAKLPKDERRKIETAVERYINRDMVPKVPPVNVRQGMSLEQLQAEVALNQHHREEALRHIMGVEEVLSAVRRPE